MNSLFRTLLLSLLVGLPLAANAELPALDIEYSVSKDGFNLGSNQRTLRKTGDNEYTARAVTKAEGFAALFVSDTVKETSRFRFVDGHIQPLHYRYHKNGKKPETFEVDYDRQAQLLRHSLLDETPPLQKNDQDLMTFQFAMMLDLQQSIRKLEYRIADKKRIEDYTLIPRGEKTFDTAMGKLHTVVMEYYDQKRNRTYTFWCARELDYLPYQTRRLDSDGDTIELKLRRYNGKSL
ncbi:MAG: DUF3108 domain-containing protein [Thiohalophilus sp.]|uniref:DUF3108 domain-containing protein n=1 Tax=Thiohalophilus sp. TaxID=3028392 RepID=UPI0028709A52|nr:DUF3108 domain-containing protein [Thiohalophilus sp.]MDR9436892.1 DUF3108 domain-containing protein [Thiohalophilus sp.]